MNDTGCFQRPSPNPRNISWWQAAFSDLRLPHSWRSILPWCFHGYSRSWSGLMQRLSLLVDIFFRGSDFGYNSIIQSLECYNMGRVCQTHTCRLHRGVHFIRFASHISFFQFMFSLQSFCSCSVWYTRQALTCMSWKWGASSFFKNHFQGFFSFSMDLITNSIWIRHQNLSTLLTLSPWFVKRSDLVLCSCRTW